VSAGPPPRRLGDLRYADSVGSILLVEPEPTISDAWASGLEAAGHSVIVVVSLREALTQVGSGGIDVVVIDAYGALTGVVELARNIEALPDAPPLILASSSPAAPEISARIGAAHFLPTPCEPAEVVEIVNRVLGHVRPVLVVDDEPTGPARHPASSR
jgi:DNA-binding NtrC family response regulator